MSVHPEIKFLLFSNFSFSTSCTSFWASRKRLVCTDHPTISIQMPMPVLCGILRCRWSLGLRSTALRHRLSVVMSPEDNRLCRPLLLTPEPEPNSQEQGPRRSSGAQEKAFKLEPETQNNGPKPALDAQEKGSKPGSDPSGGVQQAWGSFCVPPKRSTLALPAPTEEEVPGQSVGRAYIDAKGDLVRGETPTPGPSTPILDSSCRKHKL